MRVCVRSVLLFLPAVFFAVTAIAEGPAASFTAESVSGVSALSVWFRDTSDPGSSVITAWAWDFGDGSEEDPFAALPDPVHHYETPGTYTVSLTVTTTEGTDTVIQTGLVTVLATTVFRVASANTSGTEDGLSWATAFNTIQEGVDAAFGAGGGEVWVARGSYTDSINAGTVDSNLGDDYCVVWMRNNVALFGGFSGVENTRQERDPVSNPVIINGENIRRCIIVNADSSSMLDGFTLQNGYVTGNPAEGGGHVCIVCSLHGRPPMSVYGKHRTG
ncbi:MAG: PKD domain-containing protein [Candidatus Hydrogenedentes bacterium]|nr:PKD domain-containing protein [Candidatus Hydrogenedentota bacterium]